MDPTIMITIILIMALGWMLTLFTMLSWRNQAIAAQEDRDYWHKLCRESDISNAKLMQSALAFKDLAERNIYGHNKPKIYN